MSGGGATTRRQRNRPKNESTKSMADTAGIDGYRKEPTPNKTSSGTMGKKTTGCGTSKTADQRAETSALNPFPRSRTGNRRRVRAAILVEDDDEQVAAPRDSGNLARIEQTSRKSSPCPHIYVPTADVGFLCGKSGNNIKDIQNKTDTRIVIENDARETGKKNDGQSKVLIYASDQKNIDAALSLIRNTLLRLTYGKVAASDGSSGGKNRSAPPPYVEMLVPANVCGIIVGENGAILNEIQERTKTKILIKKESDKNEFMSSVRILGTKWAILSAERDIVKRLSVSRKLIEWTCTDISRVVSPMVRVWNLDEMVTFFRVTGTFVHVAQPDNVLILKGFTKKALFGAKAELQKMAAVSGSRGRLQGHR